MTTKEVAKLMATLKSPFGNTITDAMIERLFELEPTGSLIRAGAVRSMRYSGTLFCAVFVVATTADFSRCYDDARITLA